MSVRSMILKGIRASGQPVAPSEDDLAAIERKVADAKPANADGFAFTAGRNWAVDRARRADAAQRRLLREAEEAEREAEERRAFEAAKAEAEAIVADLRRSVRTSQLRQLDLFWWRIFEERSADECAERLPGTNAVLRVKLLQRGRSLVETKASDSLREYLSRRVSMLGGLAKSPRPPAAPISARN